MKTHSDWLLRELPHLVASGVLDAAAAERLRAHYAARADGRNRWGRVLFPVLGGLLIGLGSILLVAHNWDDWPRSTRLGLALTPLLLGQLACVWTVLEAPLSRAWREASAAFTALAFAAALALVGQVYHFAGDLDRFLLTCALATLPLVYILDASLAAMLCAGAFTAWAYVMPDPEAPVWMVLVLFALLLPHAGHVMRRDADGLRSVALNAVLIPAFFAAILAGFPNVPRLVLWWLAEAGAILVMLEALRETRAPLWRRPLVLYGGGAVAVAALVGSFPEIWRGWSWYLRPQQLPMVWALLTAGLAWLVVLSFRAWRRGHWLAAMQAFPAVVMALAAPIDSRAPAMALAALLSAYLLVLGLGTFRAGVRHRDAGLATRGLVLIALLVLLRFVDAEWSFTARGIAFVVTGMFFTVATLWLRRRMQG